MGRIDEALRRAGVDDAVATPSATPRDEIFRSPWTTPVGAEPVAVPQSAPGPKVLADSTTTVFRRFNPRWIDLLTISPNANPLLVEQFRRLAGTLHNAQTTGRMRLVMVTSAGPGDGKTLSSVNLALTLSESYGRRVLLIDADLRRPSIHDICGVGNPPGLSEGLQAVVQQKLAVIRLTDTLSFLPAGQPDPDPMNTLTSERLKGVLEEAAERFDWVIVDTPPIGLVPDASLLTGLVDAALFVVRAGKTPFPLVAKAIDALGKDKIFGVVLNGLDEVDSPQYPAYYAGHEVQTT